MRDIAALVLMMLLGSAEAAALLLYDRRRLDAHGRSRMWNDATLSLAIASPALGLGIPAFFAVGAHVWVTRRGPWYVRVGKALLWLTGALMLQILLATAALSLLGLPLE